MSDPDEEPVSITTVDVYDLASDIGGECEHMIEKFGTASVSSLLPKVITALELLETLAMKNEKENQLVRELTSRIDKMQSEKIERAEMRHKFEKELEAIEEQWRGDSAEMVAAVTRLQDENKRLRKALAAGDSGPPSPARDAEHEQVLQRLTGIADKQRSTLREQESALQDKQQTIDSLNSQVERLTNVSKDLRRKHKQLQNQVRTVCEERAELNSLVQAQQKDIAILQTASDREASCSRCLSSDEELDKPTYSMKELQDILKERNDLKQRLHDAEEQLRQARGEDSDTYPSFGTTDSQTDGQNDAPVQGPLPYEPDDAPWKKSHSGIGKFFRKFFDSDIAISPFPRRPFTSYPKTSADATA